VHDLRRLAIGCALAVACLPLGAEEPRAPQTPLRGMTVKICEDAGEWPPYTYFERVGGKPTARVRGFAIDVIDAIFGKAGVSYSVDLLPWVRCQKEIEQGAPYHMALNASYNESRAKTYLLSRAYYRTTNYYFYSRRQHPDGLAIASLADLPKYRVCGLFGYNYETYGLKPGMVDQGARDFPALIAKLHAGRCDLFLEKYEVMAGFSAIGQPFLADRDLAGKSVPGMAPTEFYMMVSRRGEHADQLIRLINDGIAELEASRQLERMLKKYIP